MFRFAFLFAICFLLCGGAVGQNFNVRYTHDGIFGKGLSVEVKGDSLYCLSYCADTSEANGINTLLSRLDLSGSLQDFAVVGPLGYEHFTPTRDCLIKTGDGGFAYTGYTMTSQSGETNVLFVKLDSLMNVEYYREFSHPSAIYYVGRRLVQTFDKGFAIAGPIQSPNHNSDIFLLKLDSLGNYLWRETFDNDEIREDASGLFEDTEKRLWIGGGGGTAKTYRRITLCIKFLL